jgi:hypothetical protein
MKTRFFSIFSMLLVPFFAISARLFPCADFSAEGQPINISETWDVPEAGGSVYFLYRAEGNPRQLPQSLAIRRRALASRAADFKTFDQIYNYTESGADWLVFDVSFTESGIYECSTLNDAGQIVASATVTIQKEQPYSIGKSQLIVCRDVSENGDPIKMGNDFSLRTNEGLYTFFSTENAFKNNHIGYEIWQIDDFGYESFLDSRIFNCQPDWNFFKMPTTFSSNGRFKIKVFFGNNATQILAEQLILVKLI